MRLEPGSILELKRPTGENVDIYAGKVLLGNGEILVVESNLAVRVADLFYRNGVKKEESSELTKVQIRETKNGRKHQQFF